MIYLEEVGAFSFLDALKCLTHLGHDGTMGRKIHFSKTELQVLSRFTQYSDIETRAWFGSF